MIEKLLRKANNLPLLPGVYLMKNSRGEVIYVGKAKKLKNRVSSYFHGDHLPKVEAMVNKVNDFDVIVANSEFEALILENSLIKKYKPHYNILLKDDKGYPFIRLDINKKYPSFSITSKMEKDGAKYFGPYGGRSVTKDIIDTISKALQLPTCNRKFPRDIDRERPCLNYHMNTCLGWCMSSMPQKEYEVAIKQAIQLLEGNTAQLVAELEKDMLQASDELKFEQAARIRDKIKSIKDLAHDQHVISTVYADNDIIGFWRDSKSCFVVLHFVNGDLVGKDYETFVEPMDDDRTIISSLVKQYYLNRNVYPKTIFLQTEIDDMNDISEWLSGKCGSKVNIEVPKRGEKLNLVNTAVLNAQEESIRIISVEERRAKTLLKLQKALAMKHYPTRIEAIDISNLGDTGIVAALTSFVDGKPDKKHYKKFRIKDLQIHDDYESMRQVVARRCKRYADGDMNFSPLPDLLLIDGGKTHADVAEKIVKSFGFDIPIYGMVKDNRHRTRALTDSCGNEISINADQMLFSFIGNIQEETHRSAITYQRSLRKENVNSELNKIDGVGEKRRNDLLKYFKTIKEIKNADVEELKKVVPTNTAIEIYKYYHPNGEI